MQLPIDPESVKGFLAPEEGAALYTHAAGVAHIGPCLEIGSYCGKSTLYIGSACRDTGNVLFALDHHRGSEEHQPGEAYHDPDLYDAHSGRMDSFREFRRTLARAGLEDHVLPIVAPSALAARHLRLALGLVFIDGGHSLDAVRADYDGWAGRIAPGGVLAIHDLFPDPRDGGRAPWTVYQEALASGRYEELTIAQTLGFLRRLG